MAGRASGRAMLADGFHPIPAGKIAAIVTHLEMRARPEPHPAPLPEGSTLRRVPTPEPDWYRDLFHRVGGLGWLWTSRLRMPEAELATILADGDVEVHALEIGGRAEGLLELDFRNAAAPELAFLGLTEAMRGTGAGRALMAVALDRAFSRPIERFKVHTCTLDSPVALPFYLRVGFVPTRREVEIMDDPRLQGLLPAEAGPQHPILSP